MQLLGVGPGNEAGFCIWYLRANDTWYRFFIQHGILFWDTAAPDPEDDLAENEDYFDVCKQHGLSDCERIESIEMENGCLTITLATGQSLVIMESEDIGGMLITMA